MKITSSIRKILAATTLAGALLVVPAVQAQIGISVGIAPPAIPVYDQPLCPGDGYIWTPGYWAYGDSGYSWIDGAWVYPPYVGGLWTPGYWGWGGGGYLWHAGYWGRSIGYYGGINYGFGYFGTGFYGGYWNNHRFYYNRTVNNLNVSRMHNVYDQRVNTAGFSHQSFESRTAFENHSVASSNFNRGGSTPQHSFSQPANNSRSFTQQSYSRPSAPQQNYSRPSAPAQNYSRPSAPSQSYSRPSAPSGGGGFSRGGSSHR